MFINFIKIRKLLIKIPIISFNINVSLYKGRFKNNINGIKEPFEILFSKFFEILLKKIEGFFRNTPVIKPFIGRF